MVVKRMFADVSFAFGNYKFGNLSGSPKGFFEDEKDREFEEFTSETFLARERKCNLRSAINSSEQSTEKKADNKDKHEGRYIKKVKMIIKKMRGEAGIVTIRFLGFILGKLWRMVFGSIEVSLVLTAMIMSSFVEEFCFRSLE